MYIKKVYQPKVCRMCGNSFVPTQEYQFFCSFECRQEYNHKKYVEGRECPSKKVRATSTTGAMHELLVCIELMDLGFHVFRAQSASCPCDLVAMDEFGVIRVEVTTGQHNINNNSHAKKSDRYMFDLLAVVYHDRVIEWFDRAENSIDLNEFIRDRVARRANRDDVSDKG